MGKTNFAQEEEEKGESGWKEELKGTSQSVIC